MIFLLIREKLVKARVYSFVTSAMNDFTASILDKKPAANVAIESSHCKLFGTTRAWDTIYDALQVAGGAGYLSTQPFERRMRDFRVATVFEGTTEIHSIYPPLFVMRQVDKEISELPSRRRSRRSSFCSKGFSEGSSGLCTSTKNRCAKPRGLLVPVRMPYAGCFLGGLLLYGKKASEKQFFLRRLTTLSFYHFGLMASMARIALDKKEGLPIRENLILLEYFTEEAREARRKNKRVFDSKKERLNSRVFEGLWNSSPQRGRGLS